MCADPTAGAAGRPHCAARGRRRGARSRRARLSPGPRGRGSPGRWCDRPGRPGAAWEGRRRVGPAGAGARGGVPEDPGLPAHELRARRGSRGREVPAPSVLRADGTPVRAWRWIAVGSRKELARGRPLPARMRMRMPAWAKSASRCGGAAAYAAARRGHLRGVRRSTVHIMAQRASGRPRERALSKIRTRFETAVRLTRIRIARQRSSAPRLY